MKDHIRSAVIGFSLAVILLTGLGAASIGYTSSVYNLLVRTNATVSGGMRVVGTFTNDTLTASRLVAGSSAKTFASVATTGLVDGTGAAADATDVSGALGFTPIATSANLVSWSGIAPGYINARWKVQDQGDGASLQVLASNDSTGYAGMAFYGQAGTGTAKMQFYWQASDNTLHFYKGGAEIWSISATGAAAFTGDLAALSLTVGGKAVTLGAADSGGTGFKVLRVVN